MASMPPRALKVGKIIDKTLGVLEHCSGVALLYLAGLTVVNGAIAYVELGMAPMQQLGLELLKLPVGIVFAYLLLDAMLGKTGLRSRQGGEVFYSYLLLSIVYSLGIFLGFVAVILPGLYFMARWSLAQPMLIARGGRPMKALGESWERTRESDFAILVAILVVMVPLIAILIAISMSFEKDNLVGLVVSQLATGAISTVLLAMGVALYGLLVGRAVDATPPG